MQGTLLLSPEEAVLIEAFIGFFLIISIFLYKYSNNMTFKYWGLGWSIFTITAVTTVLSPGTGLVPLDVIGTGGMILSGILIYDGTMRRKRIGYQRLMYVIPPLIAVAMVPIGLYYNIHNSLVFTPIGFVVAIACFLSVKKVRDGELINTDNLKLLEVGYALWGFSMLLFPLELFIGFLDLHSILIASGVILTGASMLYLFIRLTLDDLRVQYQISQLMTGVIQHDIRNYVDISSRAVELSLDGEEDLERWLSIASRSLSDMRAFVEEMREIAIALNRFQVTPSSIELFPILVTIKERVQNEYGLSEEQILLDIPRDTLVFTNGLIKELLWNVIDNAFKHGSTILEVRDIDGPNHIFRLELTDKAGGLPHGVKSFLNTPDALSNPVAPSMGLGIVLIRGLAQLCDIRLNAYDSTVDGEVVGTSVLLEFGRAENDF